MTKHPRFLKTVVPLILIFALFTFASCRKPDTPTPILIMRNLDIPNNPAAIQTIKAEISRPDLASIFKTEPIHSRLPVQTGIGRILWNGDSLQGLFASRDSRYGWKMKPDAATALKTTLFAGPVSEMTFSVQVIERDKVTTIARETITSSQFRELDIPLGSFSGKRVTLVLATSGKGLGAWINPIITQKKRSPRCVIVLVLDALRADHLPLYGYERNTAPTLTNLAAAARTFRHAYSPSSWTLPAHVSLFSGLDVSAHGVISPEHRIDSSTQLLSEAFASAGFVTAAFTGGGFVEDSYGFHRGFQHYSNRPGDVFSMNSAERVFRYFRSFHRRFRDLDGFYFLHTYQTHAPYKAPFPYPSSFHPGSKLNMRGVSNFLHLPGELFQSLPPGERENLIDLYDGSILYSDQHLIKPLVEYLQAEGLYETAMLVVLSDHGEEFFDHGAWEHGHTLYRELIQVPLVMKYPQSQLRGWEEKPISIQSIPNRILTAYGLDTKDFPAVNSPFVQSLPICPTIAALPTRVSVIDGSVQYIRTIPKTGSTGIFQPPPVFHETEIFGLTGATETVGASLNPAEKARFLNLIKTELQRLQRNTTQKQGLSQALKEKLKQLGYLQ